LPFRHEALIYHGADTLLDAVRPFLGTDEPVLVTAHPDSPLSELPGFVEIPRNPARIIPFWRDFVDAHDGPVRGIGEPVWAGRSGAELVECQLHESLLNLAFDEDFTLLCPYDTVTLDETLILEAQRSHPHVDGAASHAYRVDEFPLAPLPPPPSGAHLLAFDLDSLHEVRRFVTQHGGWPDLVLAIDELAANSIRHGGGRGIVRMWSDNGSLVCEVRDQGRIADPLAGRSRPDDDGVGGRGLWIANLVCDLVQIRPGAVRVRGPKSAPARRPV
jgi:anti-sigma regulatory factor (Ser/Thr protein kinase)